MSISWRNVRGIPTPQDQAPRAPKWQLSLDSVLFPNRQEMNPKKFGQLNPDDREHQKLFQEALCCWGLSAAWDSVERQNSWNCLERKHGIPFYRIARLGYMAAPTPADLAGVLNANAMYSLATGFFQIIFGCIMWYENGPDLFLFVPLGISGASLVLTACNVLLDFAGKLTEVQCEQRMAESIKNRNSAAQSARLETLKAEQEGKMADIASKYGAGHAAHALQKQREEHEANVEFAFGMQKILDHYAERLQIEIVEWRKNMERNKRLLNGKPLPVLTDPLADPGGSQIGATQEWMDLIQQKQSEIQQQANTALKALKPDDPDFKTKIQNIKKEKAAQLEALETIKPDVAPSASSQDGHARGMGQPAHRASGRG